MMHFTLLSQNPFPFLSLPFLTRAIFLTLSLSASFSIPFCLPLYFSISLFLFLFSYTSLSLSLSLSFSLSIFLSLFFSFSSDIIPSFTSFLPLFLFLSFPFLHQPQAESSLPSGTLGLRFQRATAEEMNNSLWRWLCVYDRI